MADAAREDRKQMIGPEDPRSGASTVNYARHKAERNLLFLYLEN